MYYDSAIALSVACLLGGLIGIEREYHAKEAGFRTHVLVALGSALFMIVSRYGFESFLGKTSVSFDPSRIASQVVTGMGFIGAGTIIFQKKFIRGLTSAACIWVTGAIGLACGAGMYALSVFTTALVLLVLGLMNFFEKKMTFRYVALSFSCKDDKQIDKILNNLSRAGAVLRECTIDNTEKNGTPLYIVSIEIKTKRSRYNDIISRLGQILEGAEILKME